MQLRGQLASTRRGAELDRHQVLDGIRLNLILSSTSVRHRKRSLALAIVGAIWASNLSTNAIAQSLGITSPSNGAVVSPGQTLTVSVSSPNNSTF